MAGFRKKLDLAVGVLGILLLIHAAHSTIQYRAALKIKEEEFVRVPFQILLQILVSSALCLWAALSVPGSFLDILPDAKANRVVQLPENFDFMIFNHRGKLFPPKLDRSSFLRCRYKYTLSFKHNPETQALIFYTRDPPLAWNRLYQGTFEDMFLDMTGAKRLPKIRFQREISPGPPLPVPDYRQIDQRLMVSILERIGRMPRRREFTVCVIGKLFYQYQAYRINFFANVSNDVRLRPGFLFSKLLDETFDQEGKMDLETYRRLKKKVLDNFYVRHGIEVDLRYVPGTAEQRIVVFPRKINRKEIRRSLALVGIRMRLMRLRIIRPNPKSTALTWLKRLPTRCTIFPAGTQRTIPKKERKLHTSKDIPPRKDEIETETPEIQI